ncbi:hypothetical protein ACIBI9_37955 [Nonomuraea sp. NPDC050451]|uniref:hypothetical protein n=1 Tax=Nonomuraea sp. NPDC050451 TaxID=3364364 RepID=UPI003791FB11
MLYTCVPPLLYSSSVTDPPLTPATWPKRPLFHCATEPAVGVSSTGRPPAAGSHSSAT